MDFFAKIADLYAPSSSSSPTPLAMPVLVDEEIKYRVSFLLNNLTVSNLSSVCHEINDIIITQTSDSVVAWLAHYIVTKRVAAEPNQHETYVQLLTNINKELLMQAVLNETYKSVNTMFNTSSRSSSSNYIERKMLKNIGQWLGLITIGKDQPINLDDLDLKKLLIEAFVDGEDELILAVPFAAAVLKAVKKSEIFNVYSTWIQRLLSVLAGIHEQQNLKLNLKFEIEALCEALNLQLDDIEAFDVLKIKNSRESPVPSDPRTSPLVQYIENENADWSSFIKALDATIQFYNVPNRYKDLIKEATLTATDTTTKGSVDRAVDISLSATTTLIQKDYRIPETIKSEAVKLLVPFITELAPALCRLPLEKAIKDNLTLLLKDRNMLMNDVDEFVQKACNATVGIATQYITKVACEEGEMALNLQLENGFDNELDQEDRHRLVEKLPLQLQQCCNIFDAPEDFQSKVEAVYRECIYVVRYEDTQNMTYEIVVEIMKKHRIQHDDINELIKFLEVNLDICLDVTSRLEQLQHREGQRLLTLDTFCRMVSLMCTSARRSDDEKIVLLKCVLALMQTLLQESHNEKKKAFNRALVAKILTELRKETAYCYWLSEYTNRDKENKTGFDNAAQLLATHLCVPL
ncbi:unnamed protein product [Bursaphelenchus okinawaensis]|uniref:Uncharacterized protein n=1 Tax=Bursaphelenchus okinawaensis TaxID=465554 RepID=A0A811KF22_9BILA|nr:unnamed protein product [Bursaphelenchus okinawaensis]CAG9102730.1 unnamed protein product [Bursaphelenchus okinawaensis]